MSAFVLTFLVATRLWGAECPDAIASLDLWVYNDPAVSRVNEIALDGDYLYLAAGAKDLIVVDVSNPSFPEVAGTLRGPGDATSIVIHGRYAYLAWRTHGIWVVNIANPKVPSEVDAYQEFNWWPSELAISGNHLFVAEQDGLRVVNLDDPFNLTEVAFVALGNGGDRISVDGSLACVASGPDLIFFDISLPTSPAQLGTFRTPIHPNTPNDVVIEDGIAFVALGESGILTVNYSNPASPRAIDQYGTGGTVEAITPKGDILFLAESDQGFRALELDGGLVIGEVGLKPTDVAAHSILIDGIAAHVGLDSAGAGDQGLEILDIATCSGEQDGTLFEYIVAAAASAPGVANTIWKTDLMIHNLGSFEATIEIAFLASGTDNSDPTSEIHTLAPAASLLLEDIVRTTFGRTNATGAFRITSSQKILGTSRTYNDQGSSGTLGQFIAFQHVSDAVRAGQAAYLGHLERSPSYRTNIGFASCSSSSQTIEFHITNSSGSDLGSVSYTLQPGEHFQRSDLLSLFGVTNGRAITGTMTSTDPEACFFGYASVVDQINGDAIFIPARTKQQLSGGSE